MFDGSSIAGWKAINESDMILKPDLEAAYVDPFSATPMMVLFCNIVEPSTGELYGRDPRSTATRAEAYLRPDRHRRHRLRRPRSRILHVRRCPLRGRLCDQVFQIDDIELPTNTGREYDGGNMAHRPARQGRLFPRRPGRQRHGHPRRDGLDDDRDGPADGQAPPRGRRRPARARPDLWQPGRDRRPHAGLQICRPHGRPRLRQDRDLHAQADRPG